MKPRAKRLFLKATLLTLVVNAAFLFAQYKQRGWLTPRDYLAASESLATTLILLGGIAFLFSRFVKDGKDERR